MIFVTGGTGLVGSFLLRELVRTGKGPIRALKRSHSNISGLNDLRDKIEWVCSELDDIVTLNELLQGVTQVYHCAAEIGYSNASSASLFKVNREGTANLVNACLSNQVQHFMYVSSISALGANPASGMISEESKWEDNDLNTQYGISKMLGEREVWRGMAEGMPCTIVNPGIILGPAKWEYGSGKMWRHIEKESRFYVDSTNGFIDVRDVVQIMVQLMDINKPGEQYILVAGNYSINEVLQEIAGIMKKRPPTIRINSKWLKILALEESVRSFLTGSLPIVTKETARLAGKDFHYSNQKIKDLLQYQFIPLHATVEFITEIYFRERLNQ